MQAFLKDDKICISAKFEDREIIKALGDYKWDKNLRVWEFPIWKLPKLVSYLNLQFDTDVAAALQNELLKNQERHQLISLANKVKTNNIDLKFIKENFGHIISQHKKLDLEKLFNHQNQGLLVSSLFDSYALFMETGTGKTLVAIRLIELRKVPTLIVCPLSTIESVWVSEIEKWAPHLCYCNLWADIQRWGLDTVPMKNGKYYDVYIINFESFKKIKDPDTYFKFLIVDESSKMKDPKTQITKKLVALRNKIPYRLIMSGLPAPNDLLEYWGQMTFINDKILGDNFYRFRNIYFKSGGYGNFMYFPKRGAKEGIMEKVAEQAFFIKKSECLDLPDRIFEIRNITLDQIQTTVYQDMLKQNILEFRSHTTLAMNELAKIMKLRQITAGFTITTEGLAIKVSDNKINTLLDFISDELPENQQAIIWCQFHWEIKILRKLIKNSISLYGELSQQEKDFNIKQFQNKEVRFLIAHPKSGGMGLTFTNCSYIIWFSLSYSQEEHSQANDRIYRIGQKNKCTYIYILAKDTIDGIIYKALRKKQDLAQSCLEMLKGKI